MDGGEFIDLLEEAGYIPRSYSGRFMYGARCVGVDLDSTGDIFKLGIDLGERAVGREVDYSGLGSPTTDSMGHGIIAYWRDVEWPADRSEVETWRCENCGSRNREADAECNDCGEEKEAGFK